MKFIYILYRTVRTETGEYYIGVHGIDTDKYPRFNDPYLGSGFRLLSSVKKYGKKAFKRSILSISESRDVVLTLEAAMVTVKMISEPLCLNLVPGGRAGVKGISTGPQSPEHRQAISDALKGVPRSVEHCQAISDAKKGSKHSAETLQAMSDGQKGVPKPKVSAALKGVPKSVEHRQAISDAHKERRRQRNLANASTDLESFLNL